MSLPQNSQQPISDCKDFLILLILTYLVVKVIINIYYTFRGIEDPIHDINYTTSENTRLEQFHNEIIGNSLNSLNNQLYLTFPGPYQETIYRPATINSTILNMIHYLTKPIIKHLNKQEGYQFILGNIIYIICREYDVGSIYFMELVLIDGHKPISVILKLEHVIYGDGNGHINHVTIKNNSSQPGLMPSMEKKPYAVNNGNGNVDANDINSVRQPINFKRHILPMIIQ